MPCAQLEMEKKGSKNGESSSFFNNCLIWIYGVMALTSLAVIGLFWFTDFLRDVIVTDLQILNGTLAFAYWQRSPVRLIYRIYIFNYTNVEEFQNGEAEKLRVEELGPYIYRETMSRVNVQIHENDTVTYQEERSFQWEGGRPDDEMIVIPNVPLASAVAFTRDAPFMARIGLRTFLTIQNTKTFIDVSAGGLLWGYDDQIFSMSKSFLSLKRHIPFEKFGLMAYKNGRSLDRVTMYTGINDIDRLGLMVNLNGKTSRHVWGDEECDVVYGTDGSTIPPRVIDNANDSIPVYARDMCRNLPFRFQGPTVLEGIPVLRYGLPPDVFTYPRGTDDCFCPMMSGNDPKKRACPPAGIFNVSACNFDMPVLTSFPHFYAGEEWLRDQVEGLNPQRELHETYLEVHPILGVPIGGRSRFQVNLEVRKAAAVPFLGKLKDGAILPLIWIETGIDEIPEPLYNIFYSAYFTVSAVDTGMRWGSLVLFVLSCGAIYFMLRKRRIDRHDLLKRNISGQNKLLECTDKETNIR